MSARLTTGEKKFFAIAVITVLLLVAVIGGSVAALASGHEDNDVPYLHVANGNTLITVEPLIYCSIEVTNCEGSPTNKPARIPVPVGDAVMVSLSSDLSVGPWTLVVQYLTKDGFDNTAEVFYRSDSKRTFTLASTRDRNHSRLRHSSRNLPLKLSFNPFCHGLPGSIATVTMFALPSQRKIARDTNSGPLSERRYRGAP